MVIICPWPPFGGVLVIQTLYFHVVKLSSDCNPTKRGWWDTIDVVSMGAFFFFYSASLVPVGHHQTEYKEPVFYGIQLWSYCRCFKPIWTFLSFRGGVVFTPAVGYLGRCPGYIYYYIHDILYIDTSIFHLFQARNIRTSELAAIKIVKLDPGMLSWTHNAHDWSFAKQQLQVNTPRVRRPSTSWGDHRSLPPSCGDQSNPTQTVWEPINIQYIHVDPTLTLPMVQYGPQ